MFAFGAWLARWVPLAFLRMAAGSAGHLYALTHPQRVAVVYQNLQLLDASVQQKTARRVYCEFGKTLADYFFIGTRSPAQALKLISKIDGEEHLLKTHQSGKGALIVTGHLGLFELGGVLMADRGLPSAVLTLPEPTSALTKWRTAFRRGWKVDTIEIGTDSFAFLKISELLRQGHFIATLIDRPHPSERTPVSFPHGTASFSAGILLLASHCEVPIIPTSMVRLKDGTYHAQVFPPFFIKQRESRAETLRVYSQQIADTLLPVLAAYPEQWYQFVPVSASS